METQARSRVAREEWAKRIERWRESGLTCEEFASEIGVNAGTLKYWKYLLGKEARGEKRVWRSRKQQRARQKAAKRATPAMLSAPALVEIHATPLDTRFELELGTGRRVRVPPRFDATELRRLLDVLEAS